MSARNIALFFDGTWNEPDRDHTLDSSSNETNVRRLYVACGQTDTQHTFYIPGVGTDIYVGGSEKVRLEAGLYNAPRWFERMRGGLLGTGLRERVLEAYGIICSLYRPGRGDRLFIFGFSRGAFAARSLVNFVDKVGILFDAERENQLCGASFQADILNHVQDAYSLYEGKGVPDHATLDKLLERIFSNEMRSGNRESWAVRTHFMGLWDTVGTRGLPARQRQFSAPRSEDLREAVPASVMCARHALAAHEFRTLFEPLMFWETPDGHRDIEQRWFAGSHADVGGGYAARESGLSIEPLHWIAEEALQKNLEVILDNLPLPGPVLDRLHQEGSDANLWQGLFNALTNRITWSQLLQIRAHRTVRQPLRKAAIARRLALRTRQRQIAGPYRTDSAPRAWQIGGILGRFAAFLSFAFAGRTSPATKHFAQQRELVLANANNVGATVASLLATPVRQRDEFWFAQRKDLNLLIDRADRCLEKLIVAEVGLLFDHAVRHNVVLLSKCTQTPAQGYAKQSASLRWALSILRPSDIGRIHEFLATGQYIRDHLGEDRRSGPPLYSRLTLMDQACLAGLLMATRLNVDDVNRSLERLEANMNTATTDIGATTMLGTLSLLLYELARLPAFDTKKLVPRQTMMKAWSERADKLQKQQYAMTKVN